jgi:hypothetical protein
MRFTGIWRWRRGCEDLIRADRRSHYDLVWAVQTKEVTVAEYKSLGVVPLPAGTVEHDFTMLTKFQDYSAELLRLALLGITAIGIAISQAMLGKDTEATHAFKTLSSVRWSLYVSLAFFCLCAAAALYPGTSRQTVYRGIYRR